MNFGKILTRSGFLLLAGIALLSLTACGSGSEDVTPPTITLANPITSPTNNTYPSAQGKYLLVQGTVDDPNATLSISATPSSILDPSFVQATAPDWSFRLSDLVEGSNLVTITATDARGNMNTAYLTVVLDTVPPPLLLGPISTKTPYSDQKIGGISETGATINLQVDTLTSGDITPATSLDPGFTWEENLSKLQDGDNTLSVTATDQAGNSSTPSITKTITVDPNALAVTIDPLNPSVSTSSVTLTGTLPAGTTLAITPTGPATVSFQQPASGDKTWTATVSDLPSNQFSPVTVTATDGNGNSGSAEVDLFYNTAPKVTSVTPGNNATASVTSQSPIVVTFDQPVIMGSNLITLTDTVGDTYQGAATYTDSTHTSIQFAPQISLPDNHTFNVTLNSNLTNQAGRAFGGYSWTFYTPTN